MKTRGLSFGHIIPMLLLAQGFGLPAMFNTGGVSVNAGSGRGFNDQAIFIPKRKKLKGWQK